MSTSDLLGILNFIILLFIAGVQVYDHSIIQRMKGTIIGIRNVRGQIVGGLVQQVERLREDIDDISRNVSEMRRNDAKLLELYQWMRATAPVIERLKRDQEEVKKKVGGF